MLRVAGWFVGLVVLVLLGAAALMLAVGPQRKDDTDAYTGKTSGPGYVVDLYAYPMVQLDPPQSAVRIGSPAEDGDRSEDEVEHEVILRRPLLVGAYEVHQELYRAVMGSNPSADRTYRKHGEETEHDCRDWGVSPRFPVTCVSWFDAVSFANKLSLLEDLGPVYRIDADGNVRRRVGANGYRLPTEAEWEVLARAGTRDRFSGTDNLEEICGFVNGANPSTKETEFSWMSWKPLDCEDGHPKLAPVGQLQPNGFGLYDMSGNVREWVWDWYGPYEPGSDDPTGPQTGERRVERGGSWADPRRRLRVSERRARRPDTREPTLGFRLVRDAW